MIAEELDRRGSRLVIGGRNPDRLDSVTAELSDAVPCRLDFFDAVSVEHAVTLAIERFGRLDVLFLLLMGATSLAQKSHKISDLAGRPGSGRKSRR